VPSRVMCNASAPFDHHPAALLVLIFRGASESVVSNPAVRVFHNRPFVPVYLLGISSDPIISECRCRSTVAPFQ
jgi:hypothetical protein